MEDEKENADFADVLDYFNSIGPFTLHETYDLDRINFLIQNLPNIATSLQMNHNSISSVAETLYKLRLHNGTTRYKIKTRMIAETINLQTLKKEFRTFITKGYYIDIDMKQCHYTLFKWLFRDKLTLKDFQNLHLHYTTSTKQEFYKFLFQSYIGNDLALKIKQETERIGYLFPELYEQTLKDRPENLLGSFLARILQMIESVIIHSIVFEFATQGNIWGGLYFDGFMMPVEYFNDHFIQDLNDWVFQRWGIPIQFTHKQHPSPISNMQFRRPLPIRPILRQPHIRYVDPQDLIPNPETPADVVSSAMNTGKSTASKTSIETHLTLPNSAIILLTPRRIYAYNKYAEYKHLGFEFYLNFKDNIQSPYIIIQFESLHKLNMTFFSKKKILFICDESEGILNQVTSVDTNKDNHSINILVFETLLRNSSQVIMMDAFIKFSNKTIPFLKALNIKYRFYDYLVLPQERYYQYIPHKAFLTAIITKLKAGKKLYIYSSSKYFITNAIMPALNKYNFNVLYYYGEKKSTKLKDVNEEWNNINAVVATSAITVGIDCQSPFDDLFLYITQNSRNLIRDVMQSLYRPRNITGRLYIALNPNITTRNAISTFDRFSMGMQTGIELKRIGELEYTSKYNTSKYFTPARQWLLDLLLLNKMEHLQSIYDIRNELERALEFCNYKIKDCTDGTPPKGDCDFFLMSFR